MKKIIIFLACIMCFATVAIAQEGLSVPSLSEAAKGMLSPAGPTKIVNEGTVELTKRMIRGTKIINQQTINGTKLINEGTVELTKRTIDGTKIVNQQTINGTKIVNQQTINSTKIANTGPEEANQQAVNETENVADQGKKNTQKVVNQLKMDGLKATQDSLQAARNSLQVTRGLRNVKIR